MLKKLFVAFSPFALVAMNLTSFSALNASAVTVISTPRQFCEYANQFESVGFTQDCSTFSDIVGAPFTTNRILKLESGNDVILKDLNFTYDGIRAPFTLWGGSLTIDGGSYHTIGSCFFSLSYHNDTDTLEPTTLTINSGDFSADGANRSTQTPFCMNSTGATPTTEKSAELFGRILGTNSYYADFGTNVEIPVASTIVQDSDNFSKVRTEQTKISHINRTALSVRVRTPETPAEPTPETPATPETPTTPQKPVIPKAPNTALGRK